MNTTSEKLAPGVWPGFSAGSLQMNNVEVGKSIRYRIRFAGGEYWIQDGKPLELENNEDGLNETLRISYPEEDGVAARIEYTATIDSDDDHQEIELRGVLKPSDDVPYEGMLFMEHEVYEVQSQKEQREQRAAKRKKLRDEILGILFCGLFQPLVEGFGGPSTPIIRLARRALAILHLSARVKD